MDVAHHIAPMTGPKEEWLIWDRRFQFGYSCLSQRLKTNEEATQQIAQFDQQIKQLAASTKRLQEDNDGLRDRIQLLERASCQMARLDEQVQDLTASSRDLKEENSRLKDGILQLERGGCQMAQLDEQVQNLTASSRDLKEENSRLKDKILQLERGGDQMAQLDEQVQDLTASSRDLKEENSRLKDKILQLERGGDQMAQLDEQVQDLAASSRDLKQENNGFRDQMMQLEQEGTRRDEENRLAQERLREKIGVQEGEFRSVVAAMEGMNEIARAERGKRGEEIQRLRAQVETLVTAWHTPGRHVRYASRAISQATTEDEGIRIKQHPRQQQQQWLNAKDQDIEVQGVLIKAQTSLTRFEDHLRYHEQVFRRYETEAVQAFVSGLKAEYRTPLRNKLEEHGEWNWQAALGEGYRMVEAEKKSVRRSARLMVGSSQPS